MWWKTRASKGDRWISSWLSTWWPWAWISAVLSFQLLLAMPRHVIIIEVSCTLSLQEWWRSNSVAIAKGLFISVWAKFFLKEWIFTKGWYHRRQQTVKAQPNQHAKHCFAMATINKGCASRTYNRHNKHTLAREQ